MGRAPGLEHRQRAIVLSVALEAAHEQPRVDQRGHHMVGRFGFSFRPKAGEHRGHPSALQEVDLAGQHRRYVMAGPDADQVRYRVQDHDRGIEIVNQALHGRQMGLETKQAGAHASEPQQAPLDPRPQVDAHRGHVADDLFLRLFEGEIDCPLSAFARRITKMRGERGLAGARGPADQHRATAIGTLAAEHHVEAGNAG